MSSVDKQVRHRRLTFTEEARKNSWSKNRNGSRWRDAVALVMWPAGEES